MSKLKAITSKHSFSVLLAFFVTILWSSSWPIIKFGLKEMPPLIFAGMRYVIAASILLVYVLSHPKYRKELLGLSKRWWLKLIFYGLIFYTLTQGAQFFGLLYLNAITVSLLLSFTPILVLIFANLVLKEKTSVTQLLLVLLAIGGALLYFLLNPELTASPLAIVSGTNQYLLPSKPIVATYWKIVGLIIVIIGVLANAFSAILGRSINQAKEVSTLVITSISMFIGSIVLLITGLIIEDIPQFTMVSIGYVLWLSVVNTALAFTIWNFVMQKLKALEISIINNTMLFQITILAVIFLGELPNAIQWVGLSIVALAGLLIPIIDARRKKKEEKLSEEEL
ncbi:MAG: EamA family transporter [Candidatus Heimdallarchaeota archaeon]|nr:EamA family transporter [Candidatus Heimdallarchaeota archaeon]